MLEVMRECKNFFVIDKEQGNFTINNEILSGFKGSYPTDKHLLIERHTMYSGGSVQNAGIYPISEDFPKLTGTKNEKWRGNIYLCDIPPDFLTLADEIKAYIEKTPQRGFVSESFGNYRYTLAMNRKGNVVSWMDIYVDRLHKFRKMFKEENI